MLKVSRELFRCFCLDCVLFLCQTTDFSQQLSWYCTWKNHRGHGLPWHSVQSWIFFSSFVSATDKVACINKLRRSFLQWYFIIFTQECSPDCVQETWNHLYWCRGFEPKGSLFELHVLQRRARFPSRFRYLRNRLNFPFKKCMTSYPFYCKVLFHQV